MPSSRELIASEVLSGTAASVTFSSIPSNYNDLVLRVSVRHNGTGGNVWYIGAQFNTNTSTVYSETFLVSDMSSVIPASNSNETPFNIHAASMVQNNYTSNTFSNSEMYIPSYTSSQNKVWSSALVNENNASNYNYLGRNAGLWRSTDAINQIVLKPNGSVGSFVAGSTFYLYGVKNS